MEVVPKTSIKCVQLACSLVHRDMEIKAASVNHSSAWSSLNITLLLHTIHSDPYLRNVRSDLMPQSVVKTATECSDYNFSTMDTSITRRPENPLNTFRLAKPTYKLIVDWLLMFMITKTIQVPFWHTEMQVLRAAGTQPLRRESMWQEEWKS